MRFQVPYYSQTVEFIHEWTKLSLSARPTLHRWSVKEVVHVVIVSVCFAALYVAIGPGHADNLSLPFALGMWTTQCLVGFSALMGTAYLLRPFMGSKSYGAAWLIGAACVTVVSILFEWGFPHLRDEGWNRPSLIQEWGEDFLTISIQVGLIWAIYCASIWMSDAAKRAQHLSPKDNPEPVNFTSGLFKKLPVELGKDIVAVSSEQHYLRIYTPKGNALILGTMTEAMDALSRLNPVRLHRSHIVVAQHILRLNKDNSVELDCGLVFPISRRKKDAVNAVLRERG